MEALPSIEPSLCDCCREHRVTVWTACMKPDTCDCAGSALCQYCAACLFAPMVLTRLHDHYNAIAEQVEDPRIVAMIMAKIHHDIEHGQGSLLASTPIVDPAINRDPEVSAMLADIESRWLRENRETYGNGRGRESGGYV